MPTGARMTSDPEVDFPIADNSEVIRRNRVRPNYWLARSRCIRKMMQPEKPIIC